PAVARLVKKSLHEVKRSPRSADAWGKLGMVLLANRFGRDSLTCITEAERLNPADPRWAYFAALLLLTEDTEAGLKHLRRAVALSDNLPELRMKLAEVLFGLEKLEEAEEIFRQVLHRHTDNPRACLGMGRVALVRKDLPASLNYLKRAVLQAPNVKAVHS